jgi:beta-glucosidase
MVFVGLREETEGSDREHLDLPADQVELIRAIAAVAPRAVVVLSAGGVVSLEGWHDDVDAIVAGWLLGQASGGALADVLSGTVIPSGRLAESIPLRLEGNPSYLTFPGEAGHVRYGEGAMVGYRHYETVGRAVRYPFGHGLSYTTFRTGELSVDVTGDDTAIVRLRVTNTGEWSGKHVVQVYVATIAGRVRRPVRELRAFTKVALRPGKSLTVELPLDRRAFAYYDIEAGRWNVAPGAYTVQIGESAADIVEATEGAVPLLVTENGIATTDDTRRIAYTTEALGHLYDAVADGIDVRGYLHWSALDNFEWGHWAPTFGLIAVDRETFERTPKPSLAWLGEIARKGGVLEAGV